MGIGLGTPGGRTSHTHIPHQPSTSHTVILYASATIDPSTYALIHIDSSMSRSMQAEHHPGPLHQASHSTYALPPELEHAAVLTTVHLHPNSHAWVRLRSVRSCCTLLSRLPLLKDCSSYQDTTCDCHQHCSCLTTQLMCFQGCASRERPSTTSHQSRHPYAQHPYAQPRQPHTWPVFLPDCQRLAVAKVVCQNNLTLCPVLRAVTLHWHHVSQPGPKDCFLLVPTSPCVYTSLWPPVRSHLL